MSGNFATLAQLVEQRFCKAKVRSSSLRGGSKQKPPDGGFSLYIISGDCLGSFPVR
jgi:hypothetical protein